MLVAGDSTAGFSAVIQPLGDQSRISPIVKAVRSSEQMIREELNRAISLESGGEN